MPEAIRPMLDRYTPETRDDYVNALREILQELAYPLPVTAVSK